MAESGSASRKRSRDKEMAAMLKRMGIERRSGICPICYRPSGNDTFGGSGVYNHISKHSRGVSEGNWEG